MALLQLAGWRGLLLKDDFGLPSTGIRFGTNGPTQGCT